MADISMGGYGAPAEADPINRLPEPAAAKLQMYRQRQHDAHGVFRQRDQNAQNERDFYTSAAQNHQVFEDAFASGTLTKTEIVGTGFEHRSGGDNFPIARTIQHRQIGPDDEQIEERRRYIAALKKKADDARALAQEAGDDSAKWGAIAQFCEAYIRAIPRDIKIKMHKGSAPKVEKVAALSDELFQTRAQVEAIKEDIADVLAAPYPSAAAKEHIAREVEELARRGRPGVDAVIDRLGPIDWPTIDVRMSVVTADGGTGFALGEEIDSRGLEAWKGKDELIAALESEIDAIADDTVALSAEQRQERETALREKLLDAGRDEEALIESGEKEGAAIHRRPDADPRAVLGLSGDLPAPKE